jgi:hypothetical protein
VNRLDGIQAKLDRAEQQIEWADRFVPNWTASKETWALEPQIDEGKRRYIWVFRELKPIPPALAVISDEVIHHLRSVLDHLAAHLVEMSGGQPTNSTAWPVERTKSGWRRGVERRRRPWQIWRKKGGGPLRGIPIGSPLWTFIENTQPYRRGSEARNDPLLALHDSWNANKHRILNADFTIFHPEGDPLNLFDLMPFVEPIERRWLIEAGGRKVKNKTKIALFRFPADEPLPVMHVKVDAEISAQVGVGDGKGPQVNFHELLELVKGLVAQAKALTEPT